MPSPNDSGVSAMFAPERRRVIRAAASPSRYAASGRPDDRPRSPAPVAAQPGARPGRRKLRAGIDEHHPHRQRVREGSAVHRGRLRPGAREGEGHRVAAVRRCVGAVVPHLLEHAVVRLHGSGAPRPGGRLRLARA